MSVMYGSRHEKFALPELVPLSDEASSQPIPGHSLMREVSVGDKDFILRMSHPKPFLNRSERITSAIAHDIATLQRTHLAALGGIGIRIPSYATFIGSHHRTNEPTVFNLVEKLDVTLVQRRNQAHCKPIGECLMRYLEWAKQTDEPAVLDDIYHARQFGVDTRHRIWLLDIEPRFVAVSDPCKREIIFNGLEQSAQNFS